VTLLETLKHHKGGLLRIKSDLFWYHDRSWEQNPGRICLVLDVTTKVPTGIEGVASARGAMYGNIERRRIVHLLIDGTPRWVWVSDDDVEVIDVKD
jgi:hypothetical protein